MAGDWIKMRSNIATDPDVVAMACALGVDEFAVVGRLHSLWSWADQHSTEGDLPRATSAFVDRLTACPGFAEALRGVGWLEGRDSALRLPNWDRHNGATAKARVVEARKKQKQRDKCPDDTGTNQGTSSGPEKRREENKEKESASRPSPADVQPVVDYWNGASKLSKVQAVTEQRKATIRSRLGDKFFAENWKTAIERVNASPFCNGVNDRGWRADFDWFLKPGSLVKIMEGKYDHAAPAPAAKPSPLAGIRLVHD